MFQTKSDSKCFRASNKNRCLLPLCPKDLLTWEIDPKFNIFYMLWGESLTRLFRPIHSSSKPGQHTSFKRLGGKDEEAKLVANRHVMIEVVAVEVVIALVLLFFGVH